MVLTLCFVDLIHEKNLLESLQILIDSLRNIVNIIFFIYTLKRVILKILNLYLLTIMLKFLQMKKNY